MQSVNVQTIITYRASPCPAVSCTLMSNLGSHLEVASFVEVHTLLSFMHFIHLTKDLGMLSVNCCLSQLIPEMCGIAGAAGGYACPGGSGQCAVPEHAQHAKRPCSCCTAKGCQEMGCTKAVLQGPKRSSVLLPFQLPEWLPGTAGRPC